MSLPLKPDQQQFDSAVFFDIDGTLLLTRKGRRAMNGAFERHFNVSGAFDGVDFAGATDPDVLDTILTKHGLDATPGDRSGFYRDYVQRLDHILDGDVNILPGSHEILRLLRHRPVHLGIITGNHVGSAGVKLESSGLDHYFEGGAYGDDGPARERIVSTAVERFGIDPDRSVMIGDSVHDVRTGKQHGLNTVAVETGTTPAETLRDENPDLQLAGLAPTNNLISFLKKSGTF